MENSAKKQNRVRVVSLLPNVVSRESAIKEISDLATANKGGYVCVASVHMVMEAHDDPKFAAKVNAADYIVTDGMPLVWMQKLQGAKTASRVRGNDLTIALCEHAARENLKIGFYGGTQKVIDTMLERARADFPALQIAYAFSPPFRRLSDAEDGQIIREINDSGTQILFVGLGCPKQENWMAAHRQKIKPVMIGVGAAFDFYAGNLKESPELLGKLGLEWLFRLSQEPKRLWRRYLILNPRFVFLAAKQLVKRFKVSS